MPKLLFITQKIDREDDVLGVYHDWVEKLAGKLPKINVICLYRGQTQLPPNVAVFSLGKESAESNLKYLLNFYKYLWQLRNDYDVVFVHMNPKYIWLGWPLWRLWGKKIVYWNANYRVNWFMRAALMLSDVGVTSIPEAFVASKKVVATGQGIDIDLFKPDRTSKRPAGSLLYLGRISPVKYLEVLLEALKILFGEGVRVTLTVVGWPAEADKEYFSNIRKLAADLEKAGIVRFVGRVPHYQTPRFFNSHRIFINLTESYSFDKSILEAMACGTLILVSNKVYRRILGGDLSEKLMCREGDAGDLADKIKRLLMVSDSDARIIGEKLREIVISDHDLNKLADKLVDVFDRI